MIDEFIEYLDAQVGRSLYVWGAQGQTEITEKWIRSRETSEANVQRVVAFWKELQAKGIRLFRPHYALFAGYDRLL